MLAAFVLAGAGALKAWAELAGAGANRANVCSETLAGSPVFLFCPQESGWELIPSVCFGLALFGLHHWLEAVGLAGASSNSFFSKYVEWVF